MTHIPITILGSGLAGYTLAREIRKLDQQIPLRIITADDGVYYSKPQLSAAFSHGKTAENLASATVEQMAKQFKLEIIPHTRIHKIDPEQRKIYSDKQEFAYSQLVLAQGAAVVKPNLNGVTSDKIISINNLIDYRHFRALAQNKKRIAILGAGLVGCEFANDLTTGGFQIDVIALSATPLDLLLPPALGEVSKASLADIGITWHCGQSIQSIQQTNEILQLTLANKTIIDCDLLLTAIGLRPVLDLAQSCGIITKRGIWVNRYLQTNVSNIYALGDCAEVEGQVLLYVAPLVNSARALAHTLTSGQSTAVSYPPMPVIVKTPACPTVTTPLPLGLAGEWKISGNGRDQKALFFDLENKLRGFVLMGTTVAEKMALVKELPMLI